MNKDKFLGSDGYYHYIYKITFKSTNQYYYGQHSVLSCNELDDTYMGSGKMLNECYKSHESDDYEKTICCYADSFDELNTLEQEYIGNLYKTDPLCLNMVQGGKSNAALKEVLSLAGKTTQERYRQKYGNFQAFQRLNKTDEEKESWNKNISNSRWLDTWKKNAS